MIIDIPTVEGGEFIDGGPNTLGTIVRASFLNSLMKSSTATTKEIQTILMSNGIQPDDRVHDQLFKAISKMVTDKAISVTSTLGDSKELAASQFLANENNKAAKNAQTTANLANDKANEAKQEAYNAKQKAEQVPNPIADSFVIGDTTTAYKLMGIDEVKTLLGVPAADYALVDFGVVENNSRYIKANPFGTVPVITKTEIFVENEWQEAKHGAWRSAPLGVSGVSGGQRGSDLIVQTLVDSLSTQSSAIGSLTGNNTLYALKSAKCRMHVWRIKA